MKKKLILIYLGLTALVCLCGCREAVKYPSYYTLHVPPPPDPPAQKNVQATLAVREFRSEAYLRQGAIVYKSSPEQIGFYNYHRWAMDPPGFVTNAVVERLRSSGNFARIKLYDGRTDVDYILSGRLEKLEEIDYDGAVKVEIAISAQMVRLSTGETVWTNSVSEIGQVEKRDVPAVVAAMSHTMEQAIEKLFTHGFGVSTDQKTTAGRPAQE